MRAAKLTTALMIAALAVGAVSCARAVARQSEKIEALRSSVPDRQRKEALARVAEIYAKSRFHHESIEDIARIIALSDRNLDAVVYAAELVSTVGFHTATILAVAEEASEAALELPEFRDLVELAVLRSGGHDGLVSLAELAARADSGEEVAEIRLQVAAMRDDATWKTIDEAVAAVEQQQADIERTIRERLRRIR